MLQLCSPPAAGLRGEGTTGEGPSSTLIFPSMSAETLGGWAQRVPTVNPRQGHQLLPMLLFPGSPGEAGRAHTSAEAAGTSSSLAGARQCSVTGPHLDPLIWCSATLPILGP